MLQTNFYNANVTEKMSINDYLNIAKNIRNGKDSIDSELLINIYHDLKEAPLALHVSEKRK